MLLLHCGVVDATALGGHCHNDACGCTLLDHFSSKRGELNFLRLLLLAGECQGRCVGGMIVPSMGLWEALLNEKAGPGAGTDADLDGLT